MTVVEIVDNVDKNVGKSKYATSNYGENRGIVE